MPTFAQHFGINKGQAQLDFVDIDPAHDLPLFIDPYVFAVSGGTWASACNNAIVSFFQATLDAIAENDDVRGRELLNRLNEPNETCLGLSRGRPSGRGVGHEQAADVYGRLKESRAAQSGLLSDIAECELFIPRIGPDKISDITTNIIRKHLIAYTQEQCKLHNIQLAGNVASGFLWDEQRHAWHQDYVQLPVIGGKKIVLVPKASVRWKFVFSHQQYYNKFVLEFLQAEHLRQDTSLVETLRSGAKRVTKKLLQEIHPLAKNFLAEFTENHPEVLRRYRAFLGVPEAVRNDELAADFDETVFARALHDQLAEIPTGNDNAARFHDFMKGVLEFIFYPDLIYPEKEFEIDQGRKRIDILFTNNSAGGFFFRRRQEVRTSAVKIPFECKNYRRDIANPELDQIVNRLAPNRGRLGFLASRSFENRDLFIARCRDTAAADRGFIIAFVDDDMRWMLSRIADNRRDNLDIFLEERFNELIR